MVTVIWYGVGLCKLTPLSKEHFWGVSKCRHSLFGSCFCFLCTFISLTVINVKVYMFQNFLENNIWVCVCTQVSVTFKLIYLVFIMFILMKP